MTGFPSRLLERELVADGTIACRLERPADFTFRAGQYIDLTLIDPPFADDQGATRSLSLAGAPSDADLVVLARVRETAFKQSLAVIPMGTPVMVEGPADDLDLPLAGDRPIVVVAGGVGIAPVRGLLREAVATRAPLAATVFYANRRPEDAAWLDELRDLERRLPGVRLVATMTRPAESSERWTGESARLGPSLFGRYLPSLHGPRYYIVGSTLLVSALCQQLERAGVPASDIRIEMYAGY